MRKWRVVGVVAAAIAGLVGACVPPAPEPQPQPPAILTSDLPDGVAGFSYVWGLDAAGGVAPYRWSATGLPAGLRISTDGIIEGFPESSGLSEVVVTVTDAVGQSTAAAIGLSVPESAPEACVAQSCELATPDSMTVEVAGDAVLEVERDAQSVVGSVVVAGTPPPVGSVAVFGVGELLPSGLIAVVVGSAPVANGTRLSVELSDPGTAFTDMAVQALPPDEADMAVRSVVSARQFRCSGGVTLNDGSTEFTHSLKPFISATSKRAWLGSGDIWLGSGGLSTFVARIEGTMELKLEFSISGAATCSLNLPVGRAFVPTGPAGGIVLTTMPVLELQVNGAAAVEASVKLNCTTHNGWTASSGGSSGSWCRPRHEPMRVNASNGVEARLGSSMSAQVTWNDIAGIKGDIGANVSASYQPARNPQGRLSARSDWNISGCLACFWKGTPLNATFASGTVFDEVLATWGQVPGGLPDPPGSTTTTTSPTQATTTRVSVASDGTQTNLNSFAPALSGDGRYVAYSSYASNLVADDTNGREDVFVHDRNTGATTRVSVTSDGTQADHRSGTPKISADGRYITFASEASNLVPGDTNAETDVFVHDRITATTTRVSVASDGTQGNGHSSHPTISGDGRFIAYQSSASNLVAGDMNGRGGVFVHDRDAGITTKVSAAPDGTQADGISEYPVISSDGRFVAYMFSASNLPPGSSFRNVHLFDRNTSTSTQVSVASDGTPVDGNSEYPVISRDGRFVAYQSEASNLVPGDLNGRIDVFVFDQSTASTTRVPVASSDFQADDFSYAAAISGDGRFVVYETHPETPVPGNPFLYGNMFLYDRSTGSTKRVSVASDGGQADGWSAWGAISGDGRYIAYSSRAPNLVAGDTNGWSDVFVFDRLG